MTKSIYATAEESAVFMKPDTRTNAEKILYELQKEQTNGFEQGHEIDNGAIALQLIEQSAELLGALKLIAETDSIDAALDPQRAIRVASAAIAKSTGQSK